MSWVDQLASAKHKAVFDATNIENGLALGHVDLWLRDYHEVYGTSDRDMKPVLVIRHEAVPMFLNDAFWQKYQIGQKLRINDPATGTTTTRNPFAAPAASAADDRATIASLAARGAIILGCNKALMSVSSILAKQASATETAVQAEARTAVLPGVTLMPSGIFAVTRAQEAGCEYIRST